MKKIKKVFCYLGWSSVDVFGGRNQFLKVIGASECHLCGNEIIEEDELLI